MDLGGGGGLTIYIYIYIYIAYIYMHIYKYMCRFPSKRVSMQTPIYHTIILIIV